jgi:hypothetical protein
MSLQHSLAPTLLIQPDRRCPRCDSARLTHLPIEAASVFSWHECGACRYLWALPLGWSPHPEPTHRANAQ